MEIFVLTEIDLIHDGISPKTVQLFPTNSKAVAEMKRMYDQALIKFNTNKEEASNAFEEESGNAYIKDGDYRLDIYKTEFVPNWQILESIQEITILVEQMGIRSDMMNYGKSRDEVWEEVQHWANEFDKTHKDYDYPANNTSFYDEIEKFVEEKKHEIENPYSRVKRDPEMEKESEEIILDDDTNFGIKGEDEITVEVVCHDGYAVGEGIRLEYPKLEDLTLEQLAEIDEYLGGRIKDSETVCPRDVCLKYGKVVSIGIMDSTNGHKKSLIDRINVKWVEMREMFCPILRALYKRDQKEIFDSPAFIDLPDNPDKAAKSLWDEWDFHAHNYLMNIADDQDLETILKFIRKL